MKRLCAVGFVGVLFIIAACTRSNAQASRDISFVEVPFDFYRNEIILQVKVNETATIDMLLDTGTNPSAIDLTTARGMGLKLDPVGRRVSGGGSGANLAYAAKLPLLRIGDLMAKNISALAIDLSEVSRHLGKPVQGILGHSFLNGRIMQIDYPKQAVRFYSASPYPKTANRPNTPQLTVL